jgi:hypothetical protein
MAGRIDRHDPLGRDQHDESWRRVCLAGCDSCDSPPPSEGYGDRDAWSSMHRAMWLMVSWPG